MSQVIPSSERQGEGDEESEAIFLVAGQTGKLYTARLPICAGGVSRCNCPDQLLRKRACKHLLFVAHRVLKIDLERVAEEIGRARGPRREQSLRLLDAAHEQVAEAVRRMHDGREALDASVNAPAAVQRAFEAAVPSPLRGEAGRGGSSSTKQEPVAEVAARSPEPGDECPICFEDLTAPDGGTLLHCSVGCGQPVHEDCMRRYAAASNDDVLRCVLCRAPWRFPEQKGGAASKGESAGYGGAEEQRDTRISRRGLLMGGRQLIDLSVLAADCFVSSAEQARSYSRRAPRRGEVEDDQDEDEDEDVILPGPASEPQTQKAARQKAERAERARKRAASTQDVPPTDSQPESRPDISSSTRSTKAARKDTSSAAPTEGAAPSRRSQRSRSSSRATTAKQV